MPDLHVHAEIRHLIMLYLISPFQIIPIQGSGGQTVSGLTHRLINHFTGLTARRLI